MDVEFCNDCGSAMVNVDDTWLCPSCDSDELESKREESRSDTPPVRSADLAKLPTTEAGSVPKEEAMKWLESRESPSEEEIKNAFLPKPADFTGSTYPTSISNVRITGDPKFIETIAGLFKPIIEREDWQHRVEINLQRVEDRDTNEETGNYALYLSVAERG